MANSPLSTIYLVDAYADPLAVKVAGRANYLNCGPFRDFLKSMLADGKTQFVIDFEDCTGMDSTFLGILASVALELRQQKPPGTFVLTHLNERNQELVTNLGLHRLLIIDAGGKETGSSTSTMAPLASGKVDSAEVILRAHESLVEAEGGNASKFQDVLAFLKNQVDSEKPLP